MFYKVAQLPARRNGLWVYLQSLKLIMKTLLLIRHAKSSWDDHSIQDFDRPLNDRGKRDAPLMAEKLHSSGIPIDVIVASPAKRADKTAQAFAKKYGIGKDHLCHRIELYLAQVEQFYQVISAIDDRFNHAAIFSHNSGITEFANHLHVAVIDEIPTCGIFAITTQAESWMEFRNAPNKFWFFDYPKNQEKPNYPKIPFYGY
jgi:phosphohistidine phosphatase